MAFWKKFYKSKYTGAEIDAAVAKAGDATKVTANPVLTGTEATLAGLQVGNTKYKVETYPTFEISAAEWGEISTAFGAFLYSLSAADGLVYKNFTIETNAASVIEKLKAVINSGSPLVYDKLPADYGGLVLLGALGPKGFTTFAISEYFGSPLSKRISMNFEVVFNAEETHVTFTVVAQVVPEDT